MPTGRTSPLIPVLLVLASGCAAPPAGDTRPPNIVLFLADDMGYGDPRCNHPESKIDTPNLDRIAAAGMRFTDAHAPGSLCVPSRYGLLTGRYPMRAKLDVRRRPAIASDRVTIASLLQGAGYATGMVGKWHLGFDGGPDHDWQQPMTGGPLDRGFAEFFGIPASLDIPPYYYIRGRSPVAPPTGRIGNSNTAGWTGIQGAFWRAGGLAPGFAHRDVLPRLTGEAVAFLDRRAAAGDRRPFFLYFASPAPHTPWLPTEPFAGRSRVDLYGDFVMQVDDAVGQVLAALDRHGMAGDTLVIFTSDNGPVWYPADVDRFGHRSAGPWRGMKADSFEGGHRMPFLVRWPGRVAAGSVSGQTICFTDMLATFAEIAGVDLPAAATRDSRSILPLLRGEDRPVRESTVLSQGRVLRAGRYKLIDHLGSGGFSRPRRVRSEPGGPKGQLYDLVADPGETENLWQTRPEVVARLSAQLAAARRE